MSAEAQLAAGMRQIMGGIGSRLRKAHQRKATARDANPFVAAGLWDFLGPELTPTQVDGLLRYLLSPDFEQHAFNVVLLRYLEGGYPKRVEEITTSLREQIWHSLRHFADLAGDAQTRCTDLILRELLLSLQHTELPGQALHEYDSLQLAAAGYNGAAGVRNSELLSSIRTLSQYNDFAAGLRRQVNALHGEISLPHIKANQHITFDMLYVPPTFDPPPENVFEEPTTSWTAHWVKIAQRTVVLGEPGAGKSTFATKLAYDLAVEGESNEDVPVPLLVVMRDFTARFKEGGESLIAYIEARCRDPYHLSPPPGAVEYLLLNGRGVVILDGLDELSDSSLRRRVVSLIEGFACRYPLTPIVLTSRRVGYNDAPLRRSMFKIVNLGPFDDAAVERYSSLWFALQEGGGRRARQLCDAFIRDSRLVPDLRRNPLMLSLLCSIYQAEHYIPSNRPEVYHKCAMMLFEQWDQIRGIATARIGTKRRGLIGYLAWHLYSKNAQAPRLPRSRMIEIATDYLRRQFGDEDTSRAAAEDFLDVCEGRSWVLADVGATATESQYGFTHRTFLEFFAAEYLVRTKPNAQLLLKDLRGPISVGRWTEVAHLVVEVLDRTAEAGVDEFIAGLLAHDNTWDLIEHRILLTAFSARCIAYVIPSADVLADVVDAAIDLSIRGGADPAAIPHDGDWRQYEQPLATLLSSCRPDNILMVQRSLVASLGRRLTNPTLAPRTLFVAAHLGHLVEINEPYSASRADWSAAFRQLQASMPQYLEMAGSTCAWYRMERALDSPDLLPTAVEAFGLEALYKQCSLMGKRLPSPTAIALRRGVIAIQHRDQTELARLAEFGEALYPIFDDLSGPLEIRANEVGSVLPAMAEFLDVARHLPITGALGGLLLLGLPSLEAAYLEPRLVTRTAGSESVMFLVSARRRKDPNSSRQLLKFDLPDGIGVQRILERWLTMRTSLLPTLESGEAHKNARHRGV